MTIYVRNLDNADVNYRAYSDLDDVPDDERVQCMMLDASEPGHIEFVGLKLRMAMNDEIYYNLSTKWRHVWIRAKKYMHKQKVWWEVHVSNEERSAS